MTAAKRYGHGACTFVKAIASHLDGLNSTLPGLQVVEVILNHLGVIHAADSRGRADSRRETAELLNELCYRQVVCVYNEQRASECTLWCS